MALKRSRNIGGLLASRLGDRGDPWAVEDRGKHGRKMSYGGDLYNTEGEEGRNFLKATDRYYNKDAWGGGASPFLQGPSSYDETFKHKDSILGMVPDSESKDGLSRSDFGEKLVKSWDKERFPLADSETLEEAAMDKASDRKWGIDNIDPSGPAIYKQKYADSETLSDLAEDEASDLNADLGPDKMEQRGESIDESVPVPFGGLRDAFSGLFSSDDDGTGKKKKKMSKEAMKVGADLLKGYLKEPAQGQRHMATSKVTRGSVPFAGLLAQKAQRQKAPYYTPRGLV
jgi:hypothetical protein